MTGAGAGHTKNLENWQILANVYSWERSWEAGIVLVLNCPKFPNFGKAENFFQNEKKFEKLKNSGRAEICRERTNKPYIPKKAPFSHR